MYFIELESDGHVRLTSWRNGGDFCYPPVFQKIHFLFGESNFFLALFSQCFSLFWVVGCPNSESILPDLESLDTKGPGNFWRHAQVFSADKVLILLHCQFLGPVHSDQVSARSFLWNSLILLCGNSHARN